MKLTLTRDIPTEPGFYWYCNFGEHTPTILEVTRCDGKLWAQDEEFCFKVEKQNREKVIKEAKELEMEPVDGFYYGEQLWCRVPNPFLPDGDKPLKPGCY